MSDLLRPHTTIVNSGSGCVFQPIDKEVSYILTAKHNISDADGVLSDLCRFKRNGNDWNLIEIPFKVLEEGINYFPHPEKDIAIITVDRITDLSDLYRIDNLTQENTGFQLLGYPQGRRDANPDDKSLWFRSDPNLVIVGSNGGAVEFALPGNANQVEVSGQSGGPVIKFENGKALLAGIETEMARAEDENMGRAIFFPVSVFDEIIDVYPDVLSSILPAHLSCFSFLVEEAFDLDAGFSQDNILGVKAFLLFKAKLVTESGTTPYAIKKMFANRLLIAEQGEEVLQSKEIWKIWLEFLTVMQIVRDNLVLVEHLEEVFNSVRLLYSGTDKDWSSELSNMIYSDYKGLNKEGIVVVSVKKSPANNDYFIDKNIPMIANAINTRDRGKLMINEGMTFPFDHYKFVHMDFFKGKSIVDKHADYMGLVEDEDFLMKLKTEYGELFGN